MTNSRARRALALLVLVGSGAATAASPASPHLEDLTTTELRARIAAGATTALVPIGGTEQNGPYMALGKHNVRVRALAGRIAGELGNALVAPVLAYVPEGSIEPPTAHMRYAGTISIPEPAFEAVLEGAARSLRRHGVCDVFFLGDHGGYQKALERVAARLNRESRGTGAGHACRAHALAEYYRASQASFAADLAARGHRAEEIGGHAGLADTALMLAIDPSLVRREAMAGAAKPGERDGVVGDPRRATAELGEIGAARIVAASVAAIRERVGAR